MPVVGGCALCGYAKYLSRKSYFSRIMVSKQNTTAEKPKATMVESVEIVLIQRGYEEELKYMLAVFLQKADEVTIADRYWVALKPFLVYCRKELA